MKGNGICSLILHRFPLLKKSNAIRFNGNVCTLRSCQRTTPISHNPYSVPRIPVPRGGNFPLGARKKSFTRNPTPSKEVLSLQKTKLFLQKMNLKFPLFFLFVPADNPVPSTNTPSDGAIIPGGMPENARMKSYTIVIPEHMSSSAPLTDISRHSLDCLFHEFGHLLGLP